MYILFTRSMEVTYFSPDLLTVMCISVLYFYYTKFHVFIHNLFMKISSIFSNRIILTLSNINNISYISKYNLLVPGYII